MSNKKSIFLSSFLLFAILNIVAQELPKGFVYIKDVDPTIELELRYFGDENFIGQPIDAYNKEVGIVSKRAAKALKKVQRALKKKGLGLKIFDAYRPQTAVNHFIRWAKNLNDTRNKDKYYPKVDKKDLFKEGYIAARSGHSRGSTVDITIVNLKEAKKTELDMGSPWDFFGPQSWVDHQEISPLQKSNRILLQEIMRKYNFNNYPKEWWHFTLKNEPFPETYFDFPIE